MMINQIQYNIPVETSNSDHVAQVVPNLPLLHDFEYDNIDDLNYLFYYGSLSPVASGFNFLEQQEQRATKAPVAGMLWTTCDGHPIAIWGDSDDSTPKVKGDVYCVTPEILAQLDSIAGPKLVRTTLLMQKDGIFFPSWVYLKSKN